MNLADFYPSPTELIESELSVLNHLRNDPYITEHHDQFAGAATRYYARNKTNHSKGFEFFSYFDTWHRPAHQKKIKKGERFRFQPNVRLVIATLIEVERGHFQNVTYCLAVCRIGRNSFPLLRKFHFDITVSSGVKKRPSQAHPACHLQYGGEMVPQMAKMGVLQSQLNQLNPWLSEPRIFSSPISLALLVDMAFHEFPDERSKKFRDTSEWKNLVRKQESLVLKPFFEKCVDVIVDKHDRKRTLADEFYIG